MRGIFARVYDNVYDAARCAASPVSVIDADQIISYQLSNTTRPVATLSKQNNYCVRDVNDVTMDTYSKYHPTNDMYNRTIQEAYVIYQSTISNIFVSNGSTTHVNRQSNESHRPPPTWPRPADENNEQTLLLL